MYEIDYYKEKTYATEIINEGDSIGVPFQYISGKYYFTNDRLGEFLNESDDYNCRMIKIQGVCNQSNILVEATRRILPGEELTVDTSFLRGFNLESMKIENKKRFRYAIQESKKFRLNNISDVMVAYEHMDQCTDYKDKVELLTTLKEYSDRYNINLDFSLNEDTSNNLEIYTEAASNNPKRKKIENLILTVFSKLDKTGTNTDFYKKAFENMNDKQFMDYIKKVISNEDECFFLEILPYKNEPTLQDIKECLNYMGVPMDEYIYYKYEEDKDNPVRSRYKVPVG